MEKSKIVLSKLSIINEETEYPPKVAESLKNIRKFCMKSTGSKSAWMNGGRTFFIEWPIFGENELEVTGSIYEKIGSVSRRVGEYKINYEGKLTQFPFLQRNFVNKVNANV